MTKRQPSLHPHQPPSGPIDLASIQTDATPCFADGKEAGVAALAAMGDELADLQERLFAQRVNGDERRVLLVLQGMDTSGKGGTLRHTVGLMDPQGVRITSFKAPTDEEKEHHFLWRIKRALPPAGYVGVFDRSHYEDVLIVKVHEWADARTIASRYEQINDFEAELAESGVTIIKCMLHISAEEQKERLLARLDEPAKHWKFNPGDIDERALWRAYRSAYEAMLTRTNTEHAPWYVVPADRKWYRDLVIGRLLLDALRGMELEWPKADFDVAAERKRLEQESPLS